METITEARAAEIIGRGGIVFPYPRLRMVAVNGGRRRPATAGALRLAEAELRRFRKFSGASRATAERLAARSVRATDNDATRALMEAE